MRELARRKGLFGLIRVMERPEDGARLYYIGDSLQSLRLRDGGSGFAYVRLAHALLRNASNVLVIGGGAGCIANMLARDGCNVTVIDIDPAAHKLARKYFKLDKRIRWLTTDPFTFLAERTPVFDAVFIDACDARGLVPPFHEPRVLAELLRERRAADELVLNIPRAPEAPLWGDALAAKLAWRGLNVALFSSNSGVEGNELLHVSTRQRATDANPFRAGIPENWPPEVRDYMQGLRVHVPEPGTPRQTASQENGARPPQQTQAS